MTQGSQRAGHGIRHSQTTPRRSRERTFRGYEITGMEELHDMKEYPIKAVDSVENGLTSIHQRIHWPATHISGGSQSDELDRIAIEAFLDALADVAISIAAREHTEKNDEERYS